MRKLIKLVKNLKSLLLAVALPTLIILGAFIVYTSLQPKLTAAAWFDDNWAYRTGYVISNTGGAVSNQWVTVNIDTRSGSGQTLENKIQSDCDDSRFTDSNGNSLKYYLSSGCNTATTVYHVLIPTISAGSNLIYHYYGNASATAGTEAADFTQSEFSPASTSTNSEEKGASPILYWGFNNPSGNQIADTSSNAFLATRTGATWQPENFCVIGVCIYIDGTDDNISLADDAKLDFVAADKFTITIWAKHNGAISTNPDYLVTKAQTGYTGYKVYMDSDGDFCFDVRDGTNIDSACTTDANFDDDKWHHIAAVKDGTTSLKLYIDGRERASDSSIAATGTIANTGTLYIGVDLDGTSNEWLGFVDEFKIYRDQTTPTPAQISSYYNSRSNEGSNSGIGIKEQKYLTDGLVGYWNLDETSTGIGAVSRVDSSGNGTTLTDNGTTASNTGKFDKGADFELATNSEYLSAADNAVLSVTGSLTLAAWIKPETVSAGTYNILAKWDGSNESYRLYQSADELVLEIETNNTVTTQAANLAAATWYHVVGVYDATAQTAKIYLNGIEQPTAASGTIPSSITDDGGVFHIGAEDSTGGATGFYDGIIDDARVYSRAFSTTEVFKLSDFAPGPIGYWKLNEGSWTNVCSGDDDVGDSSTNGNHGIACPASTGPKGGAIGKIDRGGSFDGVNDRVDITDSGSLDVTGGATFSTWVYFNSQANEQTFFGKWDADVSYNLGSEASSTEFYLLVDGDGTAGSGCFKTSSGASLTTNTWYYLTATFDAGTTRFYKNGAYLSTASACAFSSIYAGTSKLVLAALNDNPAQLFNGRLDDVKIYNYPRTPKQIVEDMNQGHPFPGSPFGSPVAYWKFDEGYGTTANDSDYENGSENLTLNSASWTNAGKFNKAWNGTGGDIRMSVSTDADLEFAAADDFTLSLWYKSDSADNPSATEYLISDTTGNTDVGFNIYTNTDGTVCFGIDDDVTWTPTPDDRVCTISDIYDNTWHQLVATKNATSRIDLYVDGKATASDVSLTATGTLDGSNTFFVGDFDTDNAASGEEFAGDIDELKVYRGALTADEVKLDYNKASSLVLGALSDSTSGNQIQSAAAQYCVPGDSTSCAGPVGEWRLDENTSTTANDTSTNAKTATLTAGTGGFVPGRLGPAVNFDAANTKVQTSSTFAQPNPVTIEAWIFPKSMGESSTGAIYAHGAGTTNLRFTGTNALEFNQDFDTTDGRWTIADNSITLNVWNHIALTYNGSSTSNQPSIYINGKSQSVTTATTPDSTQVTTAAAWVIGNNSGQSNTFDGIIDNFRVFDYIRNQSQIAWDYNKGEPLGHWKMDECQGGTANDSSGNSYTGTWNGTGAGQTSTGDCTTSANTAWYNGRTGKMNYSLNFDGTDDYVQVSDNANNANLRFNASTDDFSLFAWVKRTTTGTEYILSKEDADDDGWRMMFNSSNNVLCSEDATDVTSSSTITDTGWHHIGCTIDRDGNGQVYIDGKSNGAKTSMGTDAMDTTSNILIGARSYSSTSFFNGQIDDARIFNYGLTQSQVLTTYNNGAVRFGPTTGPP